jgi:CheY-like chemotaxis protein
MDGAHFHAAQLRDRSLAWIPVIAMSAAAGADRRARELGVCGFVGKPLNPDHVRQALRRFECRRG